MSDFDLLYSSHTCWIRLFETVLGVPDDAGERVATVPLRDRGCRAVRDLSQPRALRDWRRIGLRLATGAAVPDSARDASLLQIENRAYLVTANYEALLGYNCAHTYALSVALLADKLPAVK